MVDGIDLQDCVPQELVAVAGEWKLADPVDGGDGRKKLMLPLGVEIDPHGEA
jgi:hypothetical protein